MVLTFLNIKIMDIIPLRNKKIEKAQPGVDKWQKNHYKLAIVNNSSSILCRP
jgi:hypothetical protein